MKVVAAQSWECCALRMYLFDPPCPSGSPQLEPAPSDRDIMANPLLVWLLTRGGHRRHKGLYQKCLDSLTIRVVSSPV